MDRADRRERGAAWVSILAGAVHGYAGPEHFSAWWGYGLFFLAAALAQGIYGLLLLTHGIDLPGRRWDSVRRPVYLAGLLGTLAIMALWLVTRTIGIPAGPQKGVIEPIGWLDGVTKAAEVVVVALLVWLLARPSRSKASVRPSP